MAGGRPTLYNAQMDNLVKEYYENKLKERQLPLMEEVALLLDIDIDTLESWMNGRTRVASEEFVGTVKKIKTLQRAVLVNTGLAGLANTAMTIFLLKANHGLKETTKHEVTGKDGEPISSAVTTPQQVTNLIDAVERIADSLDEVQEDTST